jgi:hypothetical protein
MTADDVMNRLRGQYRNSSPRTEYFRLTRREVEVLMAAKSEEKK